MNRFLTSFVLGIFYFSAAFADYNISIFDQNSKIVSNNANPLTHHLYLGSTFQDGDILIRTFTIRNDSTGPVVINKISNTLADDQYSKITVDLGDSGVLLPASLAPNQTLVFRISTQPGRNTVHRGNIEVLWSIPEGSVRLQSDPPEFGTIGLLDSSTVQVSFSLIPRTTYDVLASSDPVNGPWQVISTATADDGGAIVIQQPISSEMKFFRTRRPAFSKFRFNVAAAVAKRPGLVCPSDSNNSVEDSFSCSDQENGTICGSSTSGKTMVCSSRQCVLLGDINNDGDITIDDFETYLQNPDSRASLAADFHCAGSQSSPGDIGGLADFLAASSTEEYNTRARTLCAADPIRFQASRGRALVFTNGMVDFDAMKAKAGSSGITGFTKILYKTPKEVCIDNLGSYDPTSGAFIPGQNDGMLKGRFLTSKVFSMTDPNTVLDWVSSENNFEVDYGGDSSVPQREAVLYSSAAQVYYDINRFRSTIFNNAFIRNRSLNLDPAIKNNLINLQYRSDLTSSTIEVTKTQPVLFSRESRLPGGIVLYPFTNGANITVRSRGDYVNFPNLPPMGVTFDSENVISDYAGMMAFWVLGSNQGFPRESTFGSKDGWKTDIFPALNDGLSAWVDHRVYGNTEVLKHTYYFNRIWSGKDCGNSEIKTSVPCDKGMNLRNVMMYNKDAKLDGSNHTDGSFPFRNPPGFGEFDGPTGSDLSSMYFGAIFYDIAYEAGIGVHKADLILWKAISLIDSTSTLSMEEFGQKVIDATHALWPDDRYTSDVADVLTSRGITLYGKTNFTENLPPVIGSYPASLELDKPGGFGSNHPELHPGITQYGTRSIGTNRYIHPDASANYVAYKVYKHSKYGPCDKVAFTDGTFTIGSVPPFDWNYNHDQGSKFYAELEDRQLGNKILLFPGTSVRFLKSKQRCKSESEEGFYAEDVQPFGFRVTDAVSNGFSFSVSKVPSQGPRISYLLSVVDPSLSMIGDADYEWAITQANAKTKPISGKQIQIDVLEDEPLSIDIKRTRAGSPDANVSIRDRTNDLDRENGQAFFLNLVQ
jgi:hypothetical protein